MRIAKNDSAHYERLAALVGDLHIAILINNVGKSHDSGITFLETSGKAMDQIISINVNGALKVTQIVAPGTASGKTGSILTMGSFGALLSTPFVATYSGWRAFFQHSSTALGLELKPDGVRV